MKSRILKDSWSYCSYGILHRNDSICSTKPGSFYSCYSCKQPTDTDGNAVDVSITSEIPAEYTQAVADIKTEAKTERSTWKRFQCEHDSC